MLLEKRRYEEPLSPHPEWGAQISLQRWNAIAERVSSCGGQAKPARRSGSTLRIEPRSSPSATGDSFLILWVRTVAAPSRSRTSATKDKSGEEVCAPEGALWTAVIPSPLFIPLRQRKAAIRNTFIAALQSASHKSLQGRAGSPSAPLFNDGRLRTAVPTKNPPTPLASIRVNSRFLFPVLGTHSSSFV